jgi:hypothetical protein
MKSAVRICILALLVATTRQCTLSPSQVSDANGGGSEITNGVAGIVTDASGKGLGLAAVELYDTGYVPQQFQPGGKARRLPSALEAQRGEGRPLRRALAGEGRLLAVTDSSGAFRFDSLDAGVYNLYAFDSSSARGFAKIGMDISGDSVVSVGMCTVEKLGSIRGDVVAGDQKAVDSLWAYLPGSDFAARTDTNGAFAIEGVPPGSYKLSVVPYEGVQGWDSVYFDTETLDVPPGETAYTIVLGVDTTGDGVIFKLDVGDTVTCKTLDEWKTEATNACAQRSAVLQEMMCGRACGTDSCGSVTAICTRTGP